MRDAGDVIRETGGAVVLTQRKGRAARVEDFIWLGAIPGLMQGGAEMRAAGARGHGQHDGGFGEDDTREILRL
jgi:hypothetical protein